MLLAVCGLLFSFWLLCLRWLNLECVRYTHGQVYDSIKVDCGRVTFEKYTKKWDGAKCYYLRLFFLSHLGGASASALAPFMVFPESVAMPNQSFEEEREGEKSKSKSQSLSY